MSAMPRAGESGAYRSFIADRNKALEALLANFRAEQTNILAPALRDIANYVAGQLVMKSIATSNQVQRHISDSLISLAPALFSLKINMMRQAYMLSHAGAAEAIGQSEDRITKYSATNSRPSDKKNQDIYNRTLLYLDRLSRKIMDAYQLSVVMEEDSKDSMLRVLAAMPKRQSVPRPPLTRPMKEAASDKPMKDFSFGLVSDSDWDDIVSSVLKTTLPSARGPEDLIKVPGDLAEESGVDKVYAWEYERDLTEDFVKAVRDGEDDAAKENGIEEFIHVAVIDSKTDECCAWRDGLTLTEIEEKLDGADEDEQCMGTIPPLHMNCRCRLEPVLSSISDRKSTEAKDFNTWLMT